VIPEGVTVPVVVKSDLGDGANRLLRVGDVWFRTLESNGTPSSARAQPRDWRAILDICFENREADIGRFLRRHLAGRPIGALISALAELQSQETKAAPSLCENAETFRAQGDELARAALDAYAAESTDDELLEAGRWSVALILAPPRDGAIADQSFLSTMLASNPAYTGWPMWIDSRHFADNRAHPKVKANAWEALVLSPASSGAWSSHLDFWRAEPSGKFYQLRNFQDDSVPDRVRPHTALDPLLVCWRVTEVVAVGLAMARALGWDPATARLAFAFKWTTLRGRELSAWSDPFGFIGGGRAHDDEITSCVELNLDTSHSALGPVVDQATRPLFALFDGYRLDPQAIENVVRRVLERGTSKS
jgi:hypothetical protein